MERYLVSKMFSISSEFRMMDKVQKPSDSEKYFIFKDVYLGHRTLLYALFSFYNMAGICAYPIAEVLAVQMVRATFLCHFVCKAIFCEYCLLYIQSCTILSVPYLIDKDATF
jgi:hypothetical protein